LQDQEEQFGVVVSSLKQLYGLRYIYCWHGLSAYWSGVSPDPREQGVAKYNASLHYSEVCCALLHCPLQPRKTSVLFLLNWAFNQSGDIIILFTKSHKFSLAVKGIGLTKAV